MSGGDIFVLIGTLVYIGACVCYYRDGVLPLSMLYACYAGGNVAAIWMAHWRIK